MITFFAILLFLDDYVLAFHHRLITGLISFYKSLDTHHIYFFFFYNISLSILLSLF